MAAYRSARAPISYRLAILLLAIGLPACGGSSASSGARAAQATEPGPPAQLPSARPFLLPGEAMIFELSFRDTVAGKAVVAIGEPGQMQGRPILIVRSRIESAGVARWIKLVRDDIQTWVDAVTGTPVEHRADMIFGNKHTIVAARFPPGEVVIEYERNDQGKRTRRQRMPQGEQVHDFHSALGALRAWAPEAGDAVYYYTTGGLRIWHNEVRFVGVETVRTAMGLYPALRFEGSTVRLDGNLQVDESKAPRHFVFWLSDDHKRMPLKLSARTEYGEVAAELVDYQRAERHISLRGGRAAPGGALRHVPAHDRFAEWASAASTRARPSPMAW